MLTQKKLQNDKEMNWQEMNSSKTSSQCDRLLSVSEELNSAFLTENPFGIWRIELRAPLKSSLSKKEQIEHIFAHGYLAQYNPAFAKMYKSIDLEAHQNHFPYFLFDNAKQFLADFIESGYRLNNFLVGHKDWSAKQYLGDVFGALENSQLLRIWGTVRPDAKLFTANKPNKEPYTFNQEALNSLSEHIAIIDSDGKIVAVNEAWTQFACQNSLTGNVGNIGVGTNYLETCRTSTGENSEEAEAVYEGIKKVLDGVSPSFTIEYPCHSPSQQRWFLLVATPLRDGSGAVIAHLDITARKLTEVALAESQARFQQLTDNIEAVFWIYDVNSGKTEYLSPAFKRLWGYAADPLERHHEKWLNVIHLEDVETYKKAFADLQTTGAFDIEYRIIADSGKVHWIRDKGFAIYEGAKLARVAGVREDFTARRQMKIEREEMLAKVQAAYSEAEAANRLKDEFLATISHELRTPLTSIVGWTQMLLNDQLDERTMRRGLEAINRSANAQTQLIEDLLDVSRIIRGKLKIEPQFVNVEPIVEAAVVSVKTTAGAKNITINCASELEDTVVHADPRRLQQVLWNLLTNAIKFTPRNGTIEVNLKNAGAFIEISVKDSGIGIAPEVLPRIFDRFSQADGKTTRRFGGLGLGLAIVRHLTEIHGGTVEAASEGEGKGATFIVRFPVTEQLRETAELEQAQFILAELAPQKRFNEVARLDGIRLLVIDDDRDNLEWLTILLKKFGAKVETAQSAAEAVNKYLPFKPDLIISDIGMPDEDGYSLIRKIREIAAQDGGQKPAIALTAFAKTEDTKRALAAGFQKHLKKPVEPAVLLDNVNQLLENWQAK
jgi:PAS domain S-box-containing protein